MRRNMSFGFFTSVCSVIMLNACQTLPITTTADLTPSASSLPPQPPSASVPTIDRSAEMIPTSTALPTAEQVPHHLQPSPSSGPLPTPYPTPIFQPQPPQEPNPWPTHLNLRQEGDPIPTPPPEPTPHPGDCGSCRVSWSEIRQTAWAGESLVYLQFKLSRELRVHRSNQSSSQFFKFKPGAALASSAPNTLYSQVTDVWSLDEQSLLLLSPLGAEANLFRMSLDASMGLQAMTSDRVYQAALNSQRNQLAWISYEGDNRNVALYTSALPAIQPQLVGKVTGGISQLSWMPDQQSWAFIDVNSSSLPKATISRFDSRGNQSVWLNLPTSGPWPEKTLSFKFSPDGKWLAVVVESLTVTKGNTGTYWKGVLWLGASDGKSMQRVSSLERVDADFDWSPDSSKLVVAAGSGEAEKPIAQDLYTISNQGSITRLTDSSQQVQSMHKQPRWSPDGRYISFISNREADFRLNVMIPSGLFTIKADGTDMTTIAKGQYTTVQIPPSTGTDWF